MIKKNWRKIVVGAFIVGALFLVGLGIYKLVANNAPAPIYTIDADKVTNPNVIENTLGVSKDEAKTITKEIVRIQKGEVVPAATTTIVYQPYEKPVEVVEQKIKDKAPEMPKEALEDSDKTIITENEVNGTVDVYKIDLQNDWEIGLGFGKQDESKYVPISIQRNYDKCHSIVVEAHYDIDERQFNGAEVQWKIGF